MKVGEYIEKIQDLVIDLGWEAERMSSSGQETLEKLYKLLKIESETETTKG